MIYINIHKHGPAQANEWAIQSIYNNFENPPNAIFSAGIHPWYIYNDWEKSIVQIEKMAAYKNFIAIGECGLDSVKASSNMHLASSNMHLQEQVFETQINLANKIEKPLIIHSVKTTDRILHLLKKNKVWVPVIFHGFNGSFEMAKQIIKNGHFLTFGESVTREKIRAYLPNISLEHIFLETDSSQKSIAEIYSSMAIIKNIPEEDLKVQMQQNLQKVFNIELF